jgi:hypothetical protein
MVANCYGVTLEYGNDDQFYKGGLYETDIGEKIVISIHLLCCCHRDGHGFNASLFTGRNFLLKE